MAIVVDGWLSEAALRAIADPRDVSKGESYIDQVVQYSWDPQGVSATVRGAQTYHVHLNRSSSAIEAECTCPHAARVLMCKHAVAVGLRILEDAAAGRTMGHGEVDTEDPPGSEPASRTVSGRAGRAGRGARAGRAGRQGELAAYLSSLDRDDLIDLVHTLMSHSASGARLVEMRAAAAHGESARVAAKLTTSVTRALSYSGQGYYRDSFAIAERANEALDELEQVLDQGLADECAPALLKALKRTQKLLERVDDSSGVIGDACQRAAHLYARACRDGNPDRVKLARWLVSFRATSPGWPDLTLADFVEAFDSRALAAYRSGVASLSAATTGHDEPFEVHRMLLELADHDGDVDAAIAILSRGEHPAYVGIVERLRRVGRIREAMAWVDKGVSQGRVAFYHGPNPYWFDPAQVTGWYLDDGRPEDAIAVARGVFERSPGSAAYELLLSVGERSNSRAAQREFALSYAERRATERRDGGLLVEIALLDGDLDAAWTAAEAHGAGALWEKLAAASEAERPLDVAALLHAHVSGLLGQADRGTYAVVAATLARIRRLYASGGREGQYDVQILDLREQYRRRPTMMAEFDRHALPR